MQVLHTVHGPPKDSDRAPMFDFMISNEENPVYYVVGSFLKLFMHHLAVTTVFLGLAWETYREYYGMPWLSRAKCLTHRMYCMPSDIFQKNPTLRDSYEKLAERLKKAKEAIAQRALLTPSSTGDGKGKNKRGSIEAKEDENEEDGDEDEERPDTRGRPAARSCEGVLCTKCKPREGKR